VNSEPVNPYKMFKVRLLSFPVIFTLLFSCSYGGTVRNGSGAGDGDVPSLSVIEFYQGPLNHLSAVRSGECPMYPPCSEYARESIERFGMAVGWMMAFDRLMRCGRDEMKQVPIVVFHGKAKHYDPVDNNVLP